MSSDTRPSPLEAVGIVEIKTIDSTLDPDRHTKSRDPTIPHPGLNPIGPQSDQYLWVRTTLWNFSRSSPYVLTKEGRIPDKNIAYLKKLIEAYKIDLYYTGFNGHHLLSDVIESDEIPLAQRRAAFHCLVKELKFDMNKPNHFKQTGLRMLQDEKVLQDVIPELMKMCITEKE